MCLHYIWVEVPATCGHSSDGSCKVHARLQHQGAVLLHHVQDNFSQMLIGIFGTSDRTHHENSSE